MSDILSQLLQTYSPGGGPVAIVINHLFLITAYKKTAQRQYTKNLSNAPGMKIQEQPCVGLSAERPPGTSGKNCCRLCRRKSPTPGRPYSRH